MQKLLDANYLVFSNINQGTYSETVYYMTFEILGLTLSNKTHIMNGVTSFNKAGIEYSNVLPNIITQQGNFLPQNKQNLFLLEELL